MFLRGVDPRDIRRAINRALRRLRYRAWVPLTLVADGDMLSSGTADWTASSATLSKVTGAANLRRGPNALRVLATGVNGQARSTSIYVNGATAGLQNSWFVEARVRADVGTATLIAYDVTNSANIATETWTARGWGTVSFTFTIPVTCEELQIRLESTGGTDDTYWNHVITYPIGMRTIQLPSWISRPDQFKRLVYVANSDIRHDAELYIPGEGRGYTILADYAGANSQYRLNLTEAPVDASTPIWFEASREFSALSADADVTYCDRDWLIAASVVELLRYLQAGPPSIDTIQWRNELNPRMQMLEPLNRRFLESLQLPVIAAPTPTQPEMVEQMGTPQQVG
jgi:hypothetical protein